MKTIVLCALIAAAPVHAAVFSFTTSGSAGPSQSVVPVLAVSGDGQTRHVEVSLVFDESRLSLATASGVIPGAGQNGAVCARAASNRIDVTLINTSGLPLSTSAPTTLCNLPFQVRSNAVPGKAKLQLTRFRCTTDTTPVTPCSGTDATVTITGTPTPAPPTPAAPNRNLLVLLSNEPGAPTVDQLSAFNFSSGLPPPLTGLLPGSPQVAYPLLVRRARGDFAQYLADYPHTARAKLERYVIVQYPENTDLSAPLAALQADAYVVHVQEPLPMAFSTAGGGADASAAPDTQSSAQQYHLDAVRAPQAWQRAGGWSLVGVADSGIATEHPELKSQTGPGSSSGNLIPGGNYLPYFSQDIGSLPVAMDPDPDEATPVPTGSPDCDNLDGVTDGQMVATFAGHGTHVSGLIAASHSGPNGASADGICKNCGVGVWKITTEQCFQSEEGFVVFAPINFVQLPFAIIYMAQIGAQVINQSYGYQGAVPFIGYCTTVPDDVYCLAYQFARENEVILPSASGNGRERIQFPARDSRASPIGGTDATGSIWDESPGSNIDCPTDGVINFVDECGSNFSFVGERRQELVTPARQVRSTMYPGKDWNPILGCGDSVGDSQPADGIGLCNGTSMSAPIASAVYALVRSVNPLLPAGDADVAQAGGVRNVVASTTNQAQASAGWHFQFGYGVPDTERAVARALGTVGGEVVRNRAIPLFGLYSTGAQDYATVATPQLAMALARYQAASYATTATAGQFIQGNAIPGYTSFPHETGTPSPVPRARAYILSTEYSPAGGFNTTALHLLDRTRYFPVNCTPGITPGCNINNRDFLVLTGESNLNTAFAAGYRNAGRQGYVYTSAAPGTEALRVQCNTSMDDCAVFLESQRSAFETAGYTALMPGMGNAIIGYAYPTGDQDGDGLVDAMERVIGTRIDVVDSDGDGLSDAVEFPLAAVPVNDPCSGPTVVCTGGDFLLRNGFE